MTDDLPGCQCGSDDWSRLVEQATQSGRRRRVFRCRSCGREGKVFDKGDDQTVHSGAMR